MQVFEPLRNGLLILSHVSVAIEMEAGRPGRHGDSAAQLAVQASSCASVPAITPHPDTEAASVLGQAEMRGEENQAVDKVTNNKSKTPYSEACISQMND